MRKHIAILYSFAFAAFAHAQHHAYEPDSTAIRLDEMVVTAQSAPKSAVSTAPLVAFDSERIMRSGITSVSDAVHRMPGVTLRDYGGAGGLKTVSVRGFGAGHTGVMYDAVPLSDVQSGQIDLSRYSIDNVSNVSLTIGDNDDIFIPARLAASAATINISTTPVLENTEVRAKVRAGSFGYINPFLRMGTSIGENAAINFVGEYTHADNDYPFKLTNGNAVTKEKRSNSQMNAGNVEMNALWEINSTNTIKAKAYYYNSSRRLPGPVIYYTNVSHERLREQNAMSQAQWTIRPSTKLTIKTIGKFNFSSSLYHDENGKYPGGELNQNYWQREYYASASLLFAASPNILIDYSADYFYNNLSSNLSTDKRPYRNSILQSATVKYKTTNLTVMGRLLASIYANGAKDGEAAKDATKLSPSLSLSFQPMGSQLLYLRASYKNIFRMPTFNEAYFDHYGSIDIRPESTNQTNVGITYTTSPAASIPLATFSADAYINNINDMIVAVPYNMFVWSMVNLSKARTYGLDATASITVSPRIGHSINFNAAYSLQRAMPKTDPGSSEYNKQVAYIPKHSGSASISYENPCVCFSVNGTAVSARYTTNNNLPATKINGYAEFGASAWREFAIQRSHLEVRVDAMNIFDKQYCIVARYPMPGRQYRITFTFNY